MPSVDEALHSARETRDLVLARGGLAQTAEVFRAQFSGAQAVVICDPVTFEVAGKGVQAQLRQANLTRLDPFVLRDPNFYAEYRHVEAIKAFLAQHEVIPVAVGSGAINDLVKLAAHQLKRPYLCVATAASMDGYTAFGASITYQGSKQTFTCPAPRAVVADLEVICRAPEAMTASGYADLAAKITCGADWILADALNVEPIEPTVWAIAQGNLRHALSDPVGARAGRESAIRPLTEGLMLSGFAMQAYQSSRPASGAEHQFSHLWDMERHTHQGSAPSHGFKVGIATLAVTALYEVLFQLPLDQLDVEACCAHWPDAAGAEANARQLLQGTEIVHVGVTETLAKHIPVTELRIQLERLKTVWPALRPKLAAQLLSLAQLKQNLGDVGAPVEPEEIGISRQRLRDSFRRAQTIRRRFTILDLVMRTGTLDSCLRGLFGPDRIWAIQ